MKNYDIYDKYDELEDIDEYEEENVVINLLSIISKWFIRVGMVIAIILFIYYLFTGKIANAFLFVLGLVAAFFFGYLFMFLLDKLVSSN